jgi:hypothetical protein
LQEKLGCVIKVNLERDDGEALSTYNEQSYELTAAAIGEVEQRVDEIVQIFTSMLRNQKNLQKKVSGSQISPAGQPALPSSFNQKSGNMGAVKQRMTLIHNVASDLDFEDTALLPKRGILAGSPKQPVCLPHFILPDLSTKTDTEENESNPWNPQEKMVWHVDKIREEAEKTYSFCQNEGKPVLERKQSRAIMAELLVRRNSIKNGLVG